MLDLDAGPVDDLQIVRSISADAIDKHFLADAGALSAERIETLADVGVLEDAQYFLVQPVNDRLRCAGGREQGDPERGVDRESLFRQRRPTRRREGWPLLGHQR